VTRRGFTLVEMLLVVAILSLLISILLPALGRSREMVRRVTCASNHAQVGGAFISYANSSRGWFPANAADQTGYGPALFSRDLNPLTSMVVQLRPYCGTFDYFRCPSVPEATAPDHTGNTSNWNVWGFWYLGNYRHAGGVYTSKVTRISGRGNWTIYSDILHNRGWSGGPFHVNHAEFRAATNLVQKADNPSARWHSVANEADMAGGNVLTVGGSVRWHALSEMQKVDYGSVWHWYGWQK